MKILKLGIFTLVLLSFILTVNAANFAGYTYNTTEGALNATNVTIEIWNDETAEPSLNISYSTLSNESGYWNITIPDSNLSTGKSVKFIPRHFNGMYVDYIGANLPPFPYDDITGDTAMLNISAINFYLKEGATINISAVNESGGALNFSYMVKDVRLGFPIESEWNTPVYHKVIYLPADRNYSIEIFPAQAMPVYYDLNNLSDYSTPKSVNITFNTTTSPVRVTGRFNLSNGTGANFDEMNIINYLLEPGDMVFAGQAMPYNMSEWYGKNDIYNSSSGEYNISLEGTAMSSKVLMFAIAKSGNNYYGAFRNISPTISGGDISGFNFTLYKLLGSATNITLNKAVSTEAGGTINVSASKTTFAFVNSSNDTLTSATGHIEVELAYSNVDSNFPDFTWMLDVQQSNQGTFTLPLLNYSIKKLNMFTQNYAPLKLKYTAAQLDVSQVNITMRAFNPGGIDTDFGGIEMEMFKSSAECDVPYPPLSCDLSTGESEGEDNFKPLNAVVSGGKISFRITKGSIVIHYKNVDMIASGPPDAAFDESASSSTSGSTQEEIWRFGSLGPEIYDSLLIGFPYSGIDDSYDINVSLPYLYDNDWNIAWNTTANGTTGIGTNLTDYADYNESWFSGINCSTTDQTADCFVNTTTNIIWIQVPHFSGVGPSTRGTASSSGGTTGGGGGGGAAGNVYPIILSQTKTTSFGLTRDDKARFTFLGKTHYITAIKVSLDEATIRIESTPVEVTLKSGQEAKVNLNDDSYNDIYIKLDKTSSSGKRAYFIVKEIHEAIKKVTPTPAPKEEEAKVEEPVEEKAEESLALEEKEEIHPQAVVPLKKKTYNWIFSVLGAVLVALIAFALIIKRKEH